MQRLKNSIKEARVWNAYGQMFVPYEKLLQIINPVDVKDALSDTNIDNVDFDDIVSKICPTGRQTFSVLVLCECPGTILQFLELNHPMGNNLDAKLPLDDVALRRLQFKEEYIMDFCQYQWLFLTPIFDFKTLIPQLLPDRTVLPYLKVDDNQNGYVGSGGFGAVHICQIPPDHQKLPFEIVRKEFKTDTRTRFSFDTERRNMVVLRHIQHPNIARLLGAYCHQGKYNFLFRKANSGTLEELIKSENRPKELREETALLVALAGLSSAISALHGISPETINIIGCHRDLRLSNVLVDGSRFILADFGLSRIKQDTENSASSTGRVQGDYVCPECHEIEGVGFAKDKIGRSSDIWSFGCLIAEFVTYLLRGPIGVGLFRKRRKKRIESFRLTHYRFYESLKTDDIQVHGWLDDLDEEARGLKSNFGRAAQGMILLVREMLQLNPDDRPIATMIEQKLRTIAIYTLSEQLLSDLDKLCEMSPSVHALLEQKRFHAWLWATKILAAHESQFADGWTGDSFTGFESICDLFVELQRAVNTLLDDHRKHNLRVFLPLRDLNDRMFDLLPKSIQEKAKEYAEISMLHKSEDDTYLYTMSKEFGKRSSVASLGALARMKRMSHLTRKRNHKLALKLDVTRTQPRSASQVRQVRVRLKNDCPEQSVVIDTKDHDSKIREDFLERLELLAESLHSMDSPERYHLLHCLGFFHDLDNFSSSLVYSFPRPSHSEESFDKMVTMGSILCLPSQYEPPDLGEKFRLAYGLAFSLLQFHKTTWLHRNIRSTNIVFFLRGSVQWDPQNFYFVGLAHSRQNDKTVITEGPLPREEIDYYVDPRYLLSERFEAINDYYALGMVLLEIGLWQIVPEARGDQWRISKPEDVRDNIMKTLVPRLGPTMGKLYREAVKACLNGDFDRGVELKTNETERKVACNLGFASAVVEPLSKCLA